MIGGPGPTPNLLRQYELGAVPKEMAEENDAAAAPHGGAEQREEGKEKRSRWRWLRFWRKH